jgi:hypothetical protein
VQLKKAICAVVKCKNHSADVERCISANNLLKTSLRASLDISTEARYLFIHHNLPPVADWDARPAVLHWLLEKDRRLNYPKKAKQQPYFRHVFSEAADGESDSDDDKKQQQTTRTF